LLFRCTSSALCGLLGVVSPLAGCGDNAPGAAVPKTLWGELSESTPATFPRLVGEVGLLPELEQTGQAMTVFCPQDKVFDDLPTGLLDRLERPEYRTALSLIVKHHIVAQDITEEGAATVASVQTLANTTLQLGADLADHEDTVGGSAEIVGYGFPVGNGELHYINALLVPPLIDVLEQYSDSAASFATFARIVRASGWNPSTSGGPVTLFAPRDAAFAAYSPAALEAIVGDPQTALRFVQAHVASNAVGILAELPQVVETGAGTLTVAQATSRVTTNAGREAQVVLADIPTHQGIVHFVDAVLAP